VNARPRSAPCAGVRGSTRADASLAGQAAEQHLSEQPGFFERTVA